MSFVVTAGGRGSRDWAKFGLAVVLAGQVMAIPTVVTSDMERKGPDEPVYSEEEERQMIERLRDLGYE